MNVRSTWLSLVIFVCSLFIGCDGGISDVVVYHGQVVYINTTTPFADLTVKITDGQNTHRQTQTDAGGVFSLRVRVDEIDGSYYLLAGDSTCVPKRVKLGGYGLTEVDLGTIEVEGPSLPTVITSPLQSVSADVAVLGGEVLTNGRLSILARGICYGTEPYPTVTSQRTIDGSGLGMFTSNLKNLEYNTIYYARAYAVNRLGTAYGEQVKFTTEEGVAVVTTDSIFRITAHSAKCKGHVISDGGFNVGKRGSCWSKRPDPTVDDECTDDGSGLGEFTSTLKDLVENTTYYVRTYATNSTSTIYGEQFIITTLDGLAEVTTDSIAAITASGFTAYGTVVSDCDIPVTARGFCYGTSQYPTIDENDYTTSGKGLGIYKSNISKLEYGTTYYVRAYATNATSTVYGEQFEITTLSGLPVVITDSVSDIGSVKATCGGNVTGDGTLTVTARGVCYGTEPQPTIEDTHTTDGKGKGTYISTLKNLKDRTTYYVRAYATTAAGTSYGTQYSFKTEDGTPIVSLSTVGEPTANSVTCEGNVTGDGGVAITERGFCYSLSQYPTNSDAHVALDKGLGEFAGSLTGLKVNATYYVRAYAMNSLGVGYSEQKSFKTKDGLPQVSTTQATSTATSITAGGDVTGNGGYSVTERGICYSTSNSEPTTSESKKVGGSGNGVFSVTISELSANVTYYIRAYATNENGTVYGETMSVKTKSGAAVVATSGVTNLKALSATGSVTVSYAGGASLQSCGICWSTNPNPTIEHNKAIGGNQLNTAYACNISPLTPNTTYYVRAYAITDQAMTYSNEVSFTTPSGLPTIAVNSIQALTKSITVNASVSNDGGYSVTTRGICWSATNGNPTIADSHSELGTGTGSYNITISGLQANSTYYIRTYAQNEIGIVYSNVRTQKTCTGLQGVHFNSNPISNIKGGSATCKVIVDYNYSDVPITNEGICWSSTTTTPTIDNSKTTEGQATTSFTSTLTNLTPLTTYYVRAYITTSYGTAYSSNYVSFTTTSGLPTVVSHDITTSNVTNTSFVCSGEVTNNGDAPVTARGICWNTTGTPTISDSHSSSGSGLGSFTYTITGVSTTSQTYYVRAYATNKYGTSYGEVVVQSKNNPYHLPVYEIEGVNYMIYPQDLGGMNWSTANTTCNNLNSYGFDDWRLMTESEAWLFYKNCRSAFTSFTKYWTSSYAGKLGTEDAYYTSEISSGQSSNTSKSSISQVRPIRIMIK